MVWKGAGAVPVGTFMQSQRQPKSSRSTHSSTGDVGVEGGEAATVEGFLHVLLSGLGFVPANLQQVILEMEQGALVMRGTKN